MIKVENIQAIRGMNDYLPVDTVVWQKIESVLQQVLASYGYREIRLPILESTPLFKRAIGEVTDVVEKEMYSFEDRNGQSLTLRPEGTAGCVRAGIENGLFYNQQQRLWYSGAMFRHERPQKGRYRQFYQLGVEAFGLSDSSIDAELILLSARCWKALGIMDHIELELNSIGSLVTRTAYRQALIKFLETYQDKLDKDCRRRMYTNTLRVLDTKDPYIQQLLNNAPELSEYLDKESKQHFTDLCTLLDQIKIKYRINPRLVRGLDYYNRTVFEWVTKSLGSQGTVCAGGRYDTLVERLGGHETPAVGFAIGLERLVLLFKKVNSCFAMPVIDLYFAILDESTLSIAIQISETLRNAMPNLKLITDYRGDRLAKQFTRANKYGARFFLMFSKDKLATKQVLLKNLSTGEQETLVLVNVVSRLMTLLT